MLYMNDPQIIAIARFERLVPLLQAAFLNASHDPQRSHEDLPGGDGAKLLIMPGWADREAMGVKVVTFVPSNKGRGRPTIEGTYILMDGLSGAPLAILSARALTNVRTAAVSALAGSILARPDAKTLLMIGTGALAPHLIAAHATVRPLERVVLWGRDRERADELARRISDLPLEVEVTADLRDGLRRADIVSAATSSREVLVEGRWLAPGAHVDLVGSFAPDMREADLEVFRRGRAVVDTWRALEESGDLIPAMREGILDRDVPDLTTLLRHPERGRRSPEDITIFKTVGTSVADLAVARQLVSHAIAMGAADIETGAFAVTVG